MTFTGKKITKLKAQTSKKIERKFIGMVPPHPFTEPQDVAKPRANPAKRAQ